jgi:hypothetical protein
MDLRIDISVDFHLANGLKLFLSKIYVSVIEKM